MTIGAPQLWLGFLVFLTLCLAVDLWVHRSPRSISIREAAWWTAGWISLGLSFGGLLWLLLGGRASAEYLASYLIEWSLSVDNIFVFVLIVAGLAVPPHLRHRVLFVGALGAIVMRFAFILGGVALLSEFEWVVYVFGALLLIAAFRFLRDREPESAQVGGRAGRLLRSLMPVSPAYSGDRLTTVERGRRLATPLLLALVLVTVTDVVFAVDSIPAVFGITRDPFLAFSSNALAVLGLRALYFLIEGAMHRFRYLKPGLALLLAFIGVKLLVAPVLEVPTAFSLAAIAAILGTAAVASWLLSGRSRLAGPERRGHAGPPGVRASTAREKLSARTARRGATGLPAHPEWRRRLLQLPGAEELDRTTHRREERVRLGFWHLTGEDGVQALPDDAPARSRQCRSVGDARPPSGPDVGPVPRAHRDRLVQPPPDARNAGSLAAGPVVEVSQETGDPDEQHRRPQRADDGRTRVHRPAEPGGRAGR